jgi:activating signal cointegrator complex subunit 1
LQAEAAAITERTAARVNGILDSISDATQTEARNQGLKGLVTSAIELARLLVVQRANLTVIMPTILPHQTTLFDPITMEDIGGEDEEDLADREISCVTFPGVEKRGGDEADHPAFRNVICKARVLCRTT